MAKTAEIKKRIESVQKIGSITHAMYLVSMAKLQKNQKRIETLKTYEKLVKRHISEILAAAHYSDESAYSPFLRKIPNPINIAYIVFTSDFGLCGGYNVNIMRKLQQTLAAAPHEKPCVYMVGKSGNNKAKHYEVPVFRALIGETDVLSYSELREGITLDVIERYYNGEFDAIRVLYTRYINPLIQEIEMDQLLPIADMDTLLEDAKVDFAPYTIFEPNPDEFLDYLIRKNIKSTTYIHYLDAQTSEEAIRRLSMDNANKSGGELIDELQLLYNRERQAGITQEMAEIIGGSETT
ncbi:F0F1 ATP synthase subunit gamma [Erysipelotrichaceae bacterium]|nr:F0F1 ATP synthase subunit gamma [Erysipelotrichaceae bacterium]